MKALVADFKSTLKEPEDLLDLVFNRLPAYVIARIAALLGIRPNALTATSFLFTCISTWLLIRGELAWAALFVYMKVVFDCSDGQLARHAGVATRDGRMYDELADISGQFLIFGGIGFAMMRTGFDWSIFLLLAVSLFFMGADITIFQNFRTYYLRIYEKRAGRTIPTGKAVFLAIHGLDTLREATLRLVPLPDINVYALERGFTGRQSETLRAAFRARFRPMVVAFSIVAGTSHLFVIALLALARRLGWIFPLFILYYNAVLVLLFFIQLANNAAFKRRYMS